MSDLALRLVEHPRWQWRSGMIARVERGSLGRWPVNVRYDRPGKWPDLDDPATQGCLLAMLREVDGCDLIQFWTGGASVSYGDVEYGSGASLGEALAEALLRAWEASDG